MFIICTKKKKKTKRKKKKRGKLIRISPPFSRNLFVIFILNSSMAISWWVNGK